MNALQKSFGDVYKKSSMSVSLPTHILSDLGEGCLVLKDANIDTDEGFLISRFLHTKEAIEEIQTIILNQARKKEKVFDRKFNFELKKSTELPPVDASYLLTSIIEFIRYSRGLQTVIFECVPFKPEFIEALAESLAHTKSRLKWLSFKDCDIGDSGMLALTHRLSKMSLQVLVLDNCGLSDTSCQYLASVVKAQEAKLDSMLWNSSLRTEVGSGSTSADIASRGCDFHGEGLVVLSVNGNKITKDGLAELTRAIRKNTWLLGFCIANNKVNDEGLVRMAKDLEGNPALLVALLHGNPGYNHSRGFEASLEIAAASSVRRKAAGRVYHALPDGVVALMQRWLVLQREQASKGVGIRVPSPQRLHEKFPGANGSVDVSPPSPARPGFGGGLLSPSQPVLGSRNKNGLGEEFRLNSAYDVELELFSDSESESQRETSMQDRKTRTPYAVQGSSDERHGRATKIRSDKRATPLSTTSAAHSIAHGQDAADTRPSSLSSWRPRVDASLNGTAHSREFEYAYGNDKGSSGRIRANGHPDSNRGVSTGRGRDRGSGSGSGSGSKPRRGESIDSSQRRRSQSRDRKSGDGSKVYRDETSRRTGASVSTSQGQSWGDSRNLIKMIRQAAGTIETEEWQRQLHLRAQTVRSTSHDWRVGTSSVTAAGDNRFALDSPAKSVESPKQAARRRSFSFGDNVGTTQGEDGIDRWRSSNSALENLIRQRQQSSSAVPAIKGPRFPPRAVFIEPVSTFAAELDRASRASRPLSASAAAPSRTGRRDDRRREGERVSTEGSRNKVAGRPLGAERQLDQRSGRMRSQEGPTASKFVNVRSTSMERQRSRKSRHMQGDEDRVNGALTREFSMRAKTEVEDIDFDFYRNFDSELSGGGDRIAGGGDSRPTNMYNDGFVVQDHDVDFPTRRSSGWIGVGGTREDEMHVAAASAQTASAAPGAQEEASENMAEFSGSLVGFAKNLEMVSQQLKGFCESINESILLQKEVSQSLLANTSKYSTPDRSFLSQQQQQLDDSQRLATPESAARGGRPLAGPAQSTSPSSHAFSIAPTTGSVRMLAGGHRPSSPTSSSVVGQGDESTDEAELAKLIRDSLRSKLASMLG